MWHDSVKVEAGQLWVRCITRATSPHYKLEDDVSENESNDTWAVVELMGHLTLAGRVTRPGEYGGLWQIDIPEGETYRTEFFGSSSVYRIRVVTEEIARAYAQPGHEVLEYNAPIVSRAEHERMMQRARDENERLRYKVEVLTERLTNVLALPESTEPETVEETEIPY